MKVTLSRRDILILLAIAVVVALVSAPVYTYRIMNPTDNDYSTHIQFALDLLKHKPVPSYTLAHPMIQVLLIGILWVTRGKMGLWVGLIVVQVVAQVLTALILYLWFGGYFGAWNGERASAIHARPWTRAFWAVTLTIAAPIMALAPLDGNYYFGYIGLASYHNPTIHLLRPFALISFILAVRALEIPRRPVQGRKTEAEGSRRSLWMVIASAGIIILSALIKPNYALCILPALALLIGMRYLSNPVAGFRSLADWRMVLGGFVIPACLVLAVQGIVTYADGGSIAIQPFVVEATYSSYLPVKFLLSIVFPLGVMAVYFPAIRKDPEMLLGWAAFAAGAIQMYLLVESGDRLEHGNFRWSAQIGLFLLFAATARWLLSCPPESIKDRIKRSLLVGLAYVPHVVAGVIYYLHVISSKGYG